MQLGKGYDLFKLNIDLTESGTEHHESILKDVFRFLQLVRKNEPNELLFKEVRAVFINN